MFSDMNIAIALVDFLSENVACIVAGKSLHAYPIKAGLEDDTAVGNAVITMFAECGIVKDAYEIFTCTNRDQVERDIYIQRPVIEYYSAIENNILLDRHRDSFCLTS
ncbi:hypothetical protein P8452_07510 [Trifolium repens]|nr:hypothetical protein P8452_07510 [Trifolium repens]